MLQLINNLTTEKQMNFIEMDTDTLCSLFDQVIEDDNMVSLINELGLWDLNKMDLLIDLYDHIERMAS